MDTNTMGKRHVCMHFETRWPMRQTSPNSFEVVVALDGDIPLLNREFVEVFGVSGEEQEVIMDNALRTLAIKK